jgi:hypothetical protein
MPIARAVDMLEQMTAALSRAHDLGVVHRDLKSDNIMLTCARGVVGLREDPRLRAGRPRARSAPRTEGRGVRHARVHVARAGARRGRDASSDLYALGILFYEMTTGQLPFRSADRETLARDAAQRRPRPRVLLRPDLPEHAERIIRKLLEKDPRSRFRDGHHLSRGAQGVPALAAVDHVGYAALDGCAPAPPPPPPPAPTPGVVEWSRRAANFSAHDRARLSERSRARGGAAGRPISMWELGARASRLEGELASHSRKLDAIERRGRALRAEIGRKVEELASEESRALRDAARERERGAKLHAAHRARASDPRAERQGGPGARAWRGRSRALARGLRGRDGRQEQGRGPERGRHRLRSARAGEGEERTGPSADRSTSCARSSSATATRSRTTSRPAASVSPLGCARRSRTRRPSRKRLPCS